MQKQNLIEIARSFAYKVNLGNYQAADFFCSQKAEVPENQSEKTSDALYQFCKKEVMRSVNSYIRELKSPKINDFKQYNYEEITKAEEIINQNR